MPSLQVVASADVFGIYQEGVQQHLDDAFANKGHPDASPQFLQAAPGPFNNSSLAPSHPTSVPEPPVSQPQPPPASEVTGELASVSVADPQLQDPAAPAAAAAPAADHTAAELPEGPAQDAAAATAANGIPTAIVPTDNSVVVEAVTVPTAPDKMPDGNKRPPVLLVLSNFPLKLQYVMCSCKDRGVLVCKHCIRDDGCLLCIILHFASCDLRSI